MKFGCNYSDELMFLINQQQVDVDVVKMGYFGPFVDLHDNIAQTKDLLIHGFGWHEHIGMVDPVHNNDWALINKVMKAYKNDYLAVHFSVYEQDMIGKSDPKKVLEEGLKTFIKHSDVPVMIENMDHNPMYNRLCVMREAVEPKLITEMCEKYNLKLLLDTAHASVSAWHLNMDVYDYMSQMPLERVQEVHLVGTQLTEDQGLKDMHTPLKEHDYQLMDWLMERMTPEIITLEYGWPGQDFKWRTVEEEIREQLNEIRRRYGSNN